MVTYILFICLQLVPDSEDYKFYYAQSLFKACDYEDAIKACYQIETPANQERVLQLKVAIHYAQEDLQNSMSLAEQCAEDSPNTLNTIGRRISVT